MTSSVIYEPMGRAREYSELACNIAVGCSHGCRYCYGPQALRQNPSFWSEPRYKSNLAERFARDARRLHGDPREILFCFATDPCQSAEAALTTLGLLHIAEDERLRCQVLTKNPQLALNYFGQLLQRNHWKLGTTICFTSELMREEWEPGAPTIVERIEALRDAKDVGIPTWTSIEPVIDPGEALDAIQVADLYSDFIKIGKLNHRRSGVDWRKFLADATELLEELGTDYYIKKDLARYGDSSQRED